MSQFERSFIPFQHIVIPVMDGAEPETALKLAKELEGQVDLMGLVSLDQSEPVSKGTGAARVMRRRMEEIREKTGLDGANRVSVTQSPWDELLAALKKNPPDLLILEWPLHFDYFKITPGEALKTTNCDIVLIRGPWPEEHQKKVLVPLRGGPHAELALRLALALDEKEITALHLLLPETTPASETAFRGLERILPKFPEIAYRSKQSSSPVETILEEAKQANLLLIGTSINPALISSTGTGAVTENLFYNAPCSVMIAKTQRPLPTTWTGPEGERAGAQAISVLVDKWFAENTYHANEFDNLAHLVELKQRQNLTISLALPALNEEETIGNVIECVKSNLMEKYPLLDEIVLIDSNSSDRTREIAADLGIPVYIHQQLLPQLGARAGKGEALWKSLLVTHGDIVVWIDTDIVNIHPRFVTGVIGPMLVDAEVQFVKGFYQRPIRSRDNITQASGGGRVTELTARPMMNMFYPELSGVIQPLSGEYGGRRCALEQLPFFSGYGVETGLLIDVYEHFGLSSIAQVDLLERVHHNQSLEALSKMSFTILQAFMRKLEARYPLTILEEMNKSMKMIRYEEGNYYLEVQEVIERERPPMVSLPEYNERNQSTH